MKRLHYVAIAVALAVVLGGCSPGGTPEGFCRRFEDLINDVSTGQVTESEFRARLEPGSIGSPGGQLGSAADRLRAAIARGDESAAVSETNYLLDLCWDIGH